jgi:hypothetical protein
MEVTANENQVNLVARMELKRERKTGGEEREKQGNERVMEEES